MNLDNQNAVILNGEKWVRISSPSGWRNTVTNVTAGEPWLKDRIAEESK